MLDLVSNNSVLVFGGINNLQHKIATQSKVKVGGFYAVYHANLV